DKGMPPIAMTEAQIKDIAAFLRFRQQSAINRGAYAIQNVITGNPAKGEAYFNYHCGTCHSASGDLKGIAAKYDPVALQARFLYPESRGRGRSPSSAATVPVTVTLPSGEKFTGSLDYLDDFNVALHDAGGAYRSFNRADGVKVDVRDPLAGHQKLLKQYTDADMHNLTAYLETLK
ncbi:MAG: c-type cytochrome, partial [Acidobacteriota bacterium]|nr:c-type cytochrome [Acidobacteriota bacterium]